MGRVMNDCEEEENNETSLTDKRARGFVNGLNLSFLILEYITVFCL